jgi:dihydroneopterin aldolase
MDYLHIDGFKVSGIHGHYEHEWSKEQEFDVSLRVGFESRTAGETDQLTDTIDYDHLKQIIVDGFAEKRFLIEKLAEDIANKILEDQRAKEVSITIRKLEAWDNGVPGVTVNRWNLL